MSRSPQQDDALKQARLWMSARDKLVFRLFGYAGTGKTTLARELGRYRSTLFAAFTGKAAHVMRQRGCEPVSTIHSLLYRAYYDQQNERWNYTPRERYEFGGTDLIVIDEASMLPPRLAHDLLALGIPILVLADPAQLPPPAMMSNPQTGDDAFAVTDGHHPWARTHPMK